MSDFLYRKMSSAGAAGDISQIDAKACFPDIL
jgi:hypothetical protein